MNPNIVSAHSIAPVDIAPGQTMLFTVKLMITGLGNYKVYQCPWEPGNVDPQGYRVSLGREEAIAQEFFPVVIRAGIGPEPRW